MGKKLSEMTLEELWTLFPIILTEHQPVWKQWYAQEERNLQSKLPAETLVRISHIGSTVIDTIWAKPIIDILVEVEHNCDMHQVARHIEVCGFRCMSRSESRMSFNKGYTEQGFAQKVYHLHLRYNGDHDELYFRDYMNDHPTAAPVSMKNSNFASGRNLSTIVMNIPDKKQALSQNIPPAPERNTTIVTKIEQRKQLMKEKKKQVNMRPESRTFDPVRFAQTLRNGQIVILLLMLLLWLALRGAPDFSVFLNDPLSLIGKFCLFAVSVWLLSVAKEALRCLGFHFLAGAQWDYIKFGIFFSRGGAVFGKCMAAVNASGYRWAVILPCLLLGWVPVVLSLFWGNLWLYSAFAILFAGTWGDLRVLWSLRRLPAGSWVQDSPFAPGCDVYIPEA